MGKTSDVKVPRKQRQFLPVRCHNQAGRQRQNVWSQTIRRTTAFGGRCEVHTWHNEAEPARSCQQRLADFHRSNARERTFPRSLLMTKLEIEATPPVSSIYHFPVAAFTTIVPLIVLP